MYVDDPLLVFIILLLYFTAGAFGFIYGDVAFNDSKGLTKVLEGSLLQGGKTLLIVVSWPLYYAYHIIKGRLKRKRERENAARQINGLD